VIRTPAVTLLATRRNVRNSRPYPTTMLRMVPLPQGAGSIVKSAPPPWGRWRRPQAGDGGDSPPGASGGSPPPAFGWPPPGLGRISGGQLAQDVVKNAAVAVVLHLVGGIDPALGGEGEVFAARAGHFHFDILAGLQVRQAADREAVIAGQLERI